MQQHISIAVAAALASALALPVEAASSAADGPARDFNLQWSIHVDGFPPGTKEARVWIAIPQDLPEQKVQGLAVQTDLPWKTVEDGTFHNKVVQVTVKNPRASFTIPLSARVHRDPVRGPRAAALAKKEQPLFLREESLVRFTPRVKTLADSIPNDNRARYDYVLAAMTYDKTEPGWGRGDVARACSVGKGNCTDFHSLFMALERVSGVPCVFEMGYPTTPDGETNKAGGYHCWAWFYDAAQNGWMPVDISEADKHPEKAEFFYGNLDADRITFSRGREVALPGMQGPPLNYVPSGAYVEVDGKPLEEGVTRTLTYTVRTAAAAAGN